MPERTKSTRTFYMGAWSDSFLSSFQFWMSWVAIAGTSLGLLSAIATVFARQESSARQSAKEAARTERVQAAESALQETKRKLTIAQLEVRAAMELADKADAASKPRRIVDPQKTAIVESLMTIPDKKKIFIAAGVLDQESVAFAQDIESVLTSAGFEVYFPNGIQDDASLTIGPPGLYLVLKDPKTPNQLAKSIQKAFFESGVKMLRLRSGNDDFPEDRIEIAVGQR